MLKLSILVPSESVNNVYGTKLQEQVEERLQFYETGDLPRKNLDVMEVRTVCVRVSVRACVCVCVCV